MGSPWRVRTTRVSGSGAQSLSTHSHTVANSRASAGPSACCWAAAMRSALTSGEKRASGR
jgi:hypothetical protein